MARKTETITGEPTEPDAVVGSWLAELKDARKREKDFRKDGEKILNIYDGTNQKSVPFNILFSNTETLLPALYSTVPRPVVERRFKDDDPLGKHAEQRHHHQRKHNRQPVRPAHDGGGGIGKKAAQHHQNICNR